MDCCSAGSGTGLIFRVSGSAKSLLLVLLVRRLFAQAFDRQIVDKA
jgi:hypothetical protein